MATSTGGADARPVLYVDLDDTLVSWSTGEPRGAPGADRFVRWALDRFEIRWLTTWAPSGRMDAKLLGDLCKLIGVSTEELRRIRGLSWEGGSKLDGIAWLEHLVLGRRFVWIEDESLPDHALDFLVRHGFRKCFHHCDVTREEGALRRLHRRLEDEWG